MNWTDIHQSVYTQQKSQLTRALKAKNWSRVVELANAFERYYWEQGISVPDGWSRWENAKQDALMYLRIGQ